MYIITPHVSTFKFLHNYRTLPTHCNGQVSDGRRLKREGALEDNGNIIRMGIHGRTKEGGALECVGKMRKSIGKSCE